MDVNSQFDQLPNASPQDLHAAFDAMPDANQNGLGHALLQKLYGVGGTIVDGAKAVGQGALDFGRGAEQGLTLGAGSVANGLLGGTADTVEDLAENGAADLPDAWHKWLKHYRENQKDSAAKFKDAADRSPVLTGVGEVAGMALPALATAGASAGAEGAGLGARMGMAALKGAGIGAAGGALSSEGNLTDDNGNFDASGLKKMGADAIGGGLFGGVMGAGIEGVTSAGRGLLQKAGDAIGDKAEEMAQDNPTVRQVKKSYDMGRAGITISNSNPSRELQGALKEAAVNNTTDFWNSGSNILGKAMSSAIDDADKKGISIHLGPEAKAASTAIESDFKSGRIGDMEGAQNTIQVLKKLQSGNNAKFTARGVKSYLPTVQDMIDNTDDSALKEHLINMKNQMEGKLLQSVPGLEALKNQYSRYMTGGPEMLIGGGLDNSWLSNSTDPEGKLARGVKTVLGGIESPGNQSTDFLTRVNNVADNMQGLENDNPGFMDKIGFKPDQFKEDMQNAGDINAISRSVLGDDPKAHPGIINTVLGGAQTGRGQIFNKANAAGRAVKAITESPVAALSRTLYNMPSEKLQNVANYLKQGSMKNLGEALEKGLQNKNEAMKNAALFAIMQNPKSRLLISGDDLQQPQDTTGTSQ